MLCRNGASITVTMLLTLCLSAQSAVVHSQDVESGSNDSSRLAREMASVLPLMHPLAPHPLTDAVPFSVTGFSDGTRRSLRIETRGTNNYAHLFFYVADFQRGTYRLFDITDPISDAMRIQEYLSSLGVQAASLRPERIENTLDTARRRHLARGRSGASDLQLAKLEPLSFPTEKARGGPREPSMGLQEGYYCEVSVLVYAVDPVWIELAHTYSWTDVELTLGGAGSSYDHECYANPDTGLSSWDQVSCDSEPSYNWILRITPRTRQRLESTSIGTSMILTNRHTFGNRHQQAGGMSPGVERPIRWPINWSGENGLGS